MYIPKHIKVTNVDEVWEFIQKNSFGTVVTIVQGKPIATHAPLQLIRTSDGDYITGHMAYANPQWKAFEVEKENILVIFQGPHGYISSFVNDSSMALKSSLLFDEKAPMTFSQTAITGYVPFVAHLISSMIRIA